MGQENCKEPLVWDDTTFAFGLQVEVDQVYGSSESEMGEEDMQFWSHVQPKNNWSQKFRNNAFWIF